MTEARRCPECGKDLPPDAPEGLCPQCMLKAGLASQTGPGMEPLGTVSYSPGSAGFVPPSLEAISRHFPQLEVLELLGKGGMGAVYKARQPGLDRLVAVKILPPEVSADPAFAERFTREARALARLNHASIVTIYDFGQADGLYYFIMEFVDGVNLRQAMRAGSLQPREALKVVPQICEALQFAHDEGIVHRDIKPENVLLDKKGRVKIADFGLAKLLGKSAGEASLTGTRQVMGTLHYMAPEQVEGARDVDHRADIYSLGVTFYEMLTGELPLGRFAPPSKKVHIDVRLDEVVLRALEKEPEQRYQHASDVKTEVEAIVRGTSGRTLATRRPRIIPILGVLNILLALLILFLSSADLLIGDDPDDIFAKAGEGQVGYQIYMTVSPILHYISGAVLFAAGIGLLLGLAWARKGAIAVCIFELATFVIEIPFILLYVLVPIFQDIPNEAAILDAPEGLLVLGYLVFCAGIMLAGLGYLVAQLVILQRPRVVAAFAGGDAAATGVSKTQPRPLQASPRKWISWLVMVGFLLISSLAAAFFLWPGVGRHLSNQALLKFLCNSDEGKLVVVKAGQRVAVLSNSEEINLAPGTYAFEIQAPVSMKIQGCTVSQYAWNGSWMGNLDLTPMVFEAIGLQDRRPTLPRLKGYNQVLARGQQTVFVVNMFSEKN